MKHPISKRIAKIGTSMMALAFIIEVIRLIIGWLSTDALNRMNLTPQSKASHLLDLALIFIAFIGAMMFMIALIRMFSAEVHEMRISNKKTSKSPMRNFTGEITIG